MQQQRRVVSPFCTANTDNFVHIIQTTLFLSVHSWFSTVGGVSSRRVCSSCLCHSALWRNQCRRNYSSLPCSVTLEERSHCVLTECKRQTWCGRCAVMQHNEKVLLRLIWLYFSWLVFSFNPKRIVLRCENTLESKYAWKSKWKYVNKCLPTKCTNVMHENNSSD